MIRASKNSARKNSREILGNSCRPTQQSRMELGLRFSRLIRKGEQSGLLTHIATMESVSSCETDELSKLKLKLKLGSVLTFDTIAGWNGLQASL